MKSKASKKSSFSKSVTSFLTKSFQEARQVETNYALAAFAVVAVVAIVVFVLAPKLRIIEFNAGQTLILIGMLLSTLIILVIVGPKGATYSSNENRQTIQRGHTNTQTEREQAQRTKLPKPGNVPGTLALLGPERDADKNKVIRQAVKYVQDSETERSPWLFHEVGTLKDLNDDNISLWKGIFLTIPYLQMFDEQLITLIVKWVHEGGHLAVTGFELGERHHSTNINRLIYHFGLSFNSDVVVGPEFSGTEREKDYNTPLLYDTIVARDHLLFKEVRKIALKNACSLHLEPGSQPLLLVSPNQIRELKTESARYSKRDDFYVLADGDQKFQDPYTDSKRAIAALASQDLTVKGQVLAIGTWDFRHDRYENDNDRFIKNLWCWLAS